MGEPSGAATATGTDGFVYVIRHAVALDRRSWHADDWERPLTARGQAQARALAERYAPLLPDRLLSSPALRCRETLQPTADACALGIEQVAFLEEGAPPEQAQGGLAATLARTPVPRTRVPQPATGAGAGTGAAVEPAAGGGLRGDARPLVLACTHGDVLDGLIDLWLEQGVRFDGPTRSPKSVTYELEIKRGSVRRARFVAPPPAR